MFRTVDGRHNLCRAATIGFLAAGILPMHAQNFPSRNITIVVPAAPGGGHDAVARVIGQKLRARLGWTIIVENRGGANGMIAAEAVAKSRADGRTILVSTPANNYVGPITMTAVPYKGAGPATMDVLSGQVPFGIVGMAPVLPQIRAGKLKALAVMNKARVRWLPDVPAVAESPG
jgi:tripartite-type tricarboxylate transporter receptor subunit TctC